MLKALGTHAVDDDVVVGVEDVLAGVILKVRLKKRKSSLVKGNSNEVIKLQNYVDSFRNETYN